MIDSQAAPASAAESTALIVELGPDPLRDRPYVQRSAVEGTRS
jgi:hypothetical protein